MAKSKKLSFADSDKLLNSYSAELKVTLVAHGYQVDFEVYKGKKLLSKGSGCRDYPGTINVLDAIQKLIAEVHELGD